MNDAVTILNPIPSPQTHKTTHIVPIGNPSVSITQPFSLFFFFLFSFSIFRHKLNDYLFPCIFELQVLYYRNFSKVREMIYSHKKKDDIFF
jgi:hypothetical protein